MIPPVRLGRGGAKHTEIMPDLTPKETAKEIDAAAADWAARVDRGVLSAPEEKELEAWLAADPRRAGAFARARAVSLYSERARALGPQFDPGKFAARPAASRRQFLWGGAAAAAMGGVMTAGLVFATRGQAYATKRGEMRVVPLSDGSVISLNTESRIRVVFSAAQRLIHLDAGEALFDVAKDKARPFVVQAGDTVVSAVGTSFIVQKLVGSPVQVLVREGLVDVREATAAPVRLGANMRATAVEETGPLKPILAVAVQPTEVDRVLAWREGRIAFEGETLAQAVVELQRYSDTRIVIDDPSIAKEEITGLFQANDPVGFAQAVAASFGLHADVGEKQVRIHR